MKAKDEIELDEKGNWKPTKKYKKQEEICSVKQEKR